MDGNLASRQATQASQWYDAQREQEICAHKPLAMKATKATPPCFLDGARLQLVYDGIPFPDEGDLQVLSVGSHGAYVRSCPGRCYATTCSTSLACREWRVERDLLAIRWEVLPFSVGRDDWHSRGRDGYHWAGGQVQRVWRFAYQMLWGADPKSVAVVRLNEDTVKLVTGKQAVIDSIRSLRATESSVEPVLVWAAWKSRRLLAGS